MADHGYIKIYRSLFTHEFFKPSALSEREAFIWMIVEASWRPRTRRIGQFYVDLKRGEFVASLRHLAEKWGWSVGAVRRFLNRLENEHMTGTRTDTGITIISICNYEAYQGDDDLSGTADDQDPAQDRHRTGTGPAQDRHNTEERKKGRKEEREEGKKGDAPSAPTPALPGAELFGEVLPPERSPAPIAAKRGKPKKQRLPDDWAPTLEDRAYAEARGFSSLAIDREADKFRNNHTARGSVMVNWSAAWKSWIGRAQEWSRPMAPTPLRPSATDTAIDGLFLGYEQEMSKHG